MTRGEGLRGDTVSLACPECGTVSTAHVGRRQASDFCPVCDYPLFWASGTVAKGVRPSAADTTRRAPGLAGARELAAVACPACGELNEPGAIICYRCAAVMEVPVPPVPAPVPLPQPVVVVKEVEPCGHPPIWWVVVATAMVSVAMTITVMTIL